MFLRSHANRSRNSQSMLMNNNQEGLQLERSNPIDIEPNEQIINNQIFYPYLNDQQNHFRPLRRSLNAQSLQNNQMSRTVNSTQVDDQRQQLQTPFMRRFFSFNFLDLFDEYSSQNIYGNYLNYFIDFGTGQQINFDMIFSNTNKTDPIKFRHQLNRTIKKCPICLDKIKIKQTICITKCKHKFHRKCLETWTKTKTNCPMCRYNFN